MFVFKGHFLTQKQSFFQKKFETPTGRGFSEIKKVLKYLVVY